MLEKHDFAVAHVEHVLIVLDGVARADRNPGPVSYTHLTLPTSDLV